jgi:arylsulfatase
MWMYPRLVQPAETGPERPSVILISLDTLRADHLSFYGHDRETSPYLAKFAKECVVFEEAVSASTWTTPSHASMFTGALPWEHGAGSWQRAGRLEDSWVTVAELAQEAGYTTAAFTEGGAVGGGLGFLQGFEQYNDGQFEARPWSGTAVMMFNRAERWMLQRRADPFFTFLHTFEIHAPYCSPPPEGTQFVPEDAPETTCLFEAQIDTPRLTGHGVDLYDGGILYTDWVLGGFLENLRAGGVLEKAVVIITADHGEEFGEHGSLGHLTHIYEEVIHVPLMIRFPGGQWGGMRVRELVATRDLHATIADVMGVPVAKRFKGAQSFLSLVDPDGRAPYTREHVFSHLSLGDSETAAPTEGLYEAQHFSVRSLTGRYMISDKPYLKAVQAAGKVTEAIAPWTHEAYDRTRDPGEHTNLAGNFTPSLEALRRILMGRLKRDGQLGHLMGGGGEGSPQISRESIEEMEAMGYF